MSGFVSRSTLGYEVRRGAEEDDSAITAEKDSAHVVGTDGGMGDANASELVENTGIFFPDDVEMHVQLMTQVQEGSLDSSRGTILRRVADNPSR